MDWYKKCLVANSIPTFISEEDLSPKVINANSPPVPSWYYYKKDRKMAIFYISDLHLCHHIIKTFPDGTSDENVEHYIDHVVESLLEGEIKEAIQMFYSPFVFFGGDIASDFSIAQLFFQKFVDRWKAIEKESYDSMTLQEADIKSKLEKLNNTIETWITTQSWARNLRQHLQRKTLLERNDVPEYIKKAVQECKELESKRNVIFIKCNFGWREKYSLTPGPQYLYAILGNHEFWSFTSYDDCVDAYSSFFEKLNITFLNSSIANLGKYNIPTKREYDEKKKCMVSKELTKDDKDYDLQLY